MLRLDGDGAAAPLLDTGFFIHNAVLSPDGRWLAYNSDASGSDEVYVRRFRDVGSGRWQISTDYGRHPLWGPDGEELFFWARDGAMMRVHIVSDTTIRPDSPELLFEPGEYYSNPRQRPFDISPNGKRFLMVKEDTTKGADDPYNGLTQFIVVHNWFEAVKARVPN